MPDDKLSAKEAALIAAARAALTKKPQAQASVAPARRETVAAPSAPSPAHVAPRAETARFAAPETPAPATVAPADAATLIDALMAAERAETERKRRKLRLTFFWIPIAIAALAGIWILAWMWMKT